MTVTFEVGKYYICNTCRGEFVNEAFQVIKVDGTHVYQRIFHTEHGDPSDSFRIDSDFAQSCRELDDIERAKLYVLKGVK